MPPTSATAPVSSAPPATTRPALVAALVVAALVLVALPLAAGRHLALWRGERALAGLAARPATSAEEWAAASDASPAHGPLALRAAGVLEAAANARPADEESLRLHARAADYYRRAAEADPFDGLAHLRRARAWLAATPRSERAALRDDIQALVRRAFEISPSDPSVAEEGFSLLLRGLGDLEAAERLAHKKLAVDRAFLRNVADVASIAGISVATVVDRFLPAELLAERPAPLPRGRGAEAGPLSSPDGGLPGAPLARTDGTVQRLVPASSADADPDAVAPRPALALLADFYIERLLVPSLSELVRLALDRGDLVRQLEPSAPAIVDLLVGDAAGFGLAKELWLALYGDEADGWPDSSLIFDGNLERTMVTGGFSWTIETTGAFFHDWRRTPPVEGEFDLADDHGVPLSFEGLALGRHPNQRRGMAQISQRLPLLPAGTYRLRFYQMTSSRSLNDVLRVRIMGVEPGGEAVNHQRSPRLSNEWSRVELAFELPAALRNTRLVIWIEAREVSPSLDAEFIILDYFELVREEPPGNDAGGSHSAGGAGTAS